MYRVFEDESIGGRVSCPDPPPSDPEAITRSIFGMSVNQLAQEILRNAGGKYNKIFEYAEHNGSGSEGKE